MPYIYDRKGNYIGETHDYKEVSRRYKPPAKDDFGGKVFLVWFAIIFVSCTCVTFSWIVTIYFAPIIAVVSAAILFIRGRRRFWREMLADVTVYAVDCLAGVYMQFFLASRGEVTQPPAVPAVLSNFVPLALCAFVSGAVYAALRRFYEREVLRRSRPSRLFFATAVSMCLFGTDRMYGILLDTPSVISHELLAVLIYLAVGHAVSFISNAVPSMAVRLILKMRKAHDEKYSGGLL